MKTKRIAIDGMLAAMCAVLGYIAIDMQVIKITFESLPVILGALMFGPLDGLAVGGIGTLIYQLLKYGVSATTILWILPYCVLGVALGFYAKKHGFRNTPKQILIAVVIEELVVTLMNTGVIYLDSVIYHYYFPGIVSANLVLRLGICVVKGIVFGLVVPKLTTAVKKAI